MASSLFCFLRGLMARLTEADVNQQPARAAPRPAIGPRGPVIWDRLVRYTREVWAEMKRVDWPSRPELVASTIVVVAVLGVLSAYLGAWDAFFTWLFTHVLVDMIMDDDSWYVVRNTPGVTGFVGSGARPVPLEDQEVKRLLKQLRDETPKYRITFQKGSQVRITSGPFMDFTGVVDEVMVEKEKVRVLVSIFGRATPVELNFGQVEKV